MTTGRINQIATVRREACRAMEGAAGELWPASGAPRLAGERPRLPPPTVVLQAGFGRLLCDRVGDLARPVGAPARGSREMRSPRRLSPAAPAGLASGHPPTEPIRPPPVARPRSGPPLCAAALGGLVARAPGWRPAFLAAPPGALRAPA